MGTTAGTTAGHVATSVLYDELFDTVKARIPVSNAILDRAKRVCASMQITGPYRLPDNVVFVERAKGSKIWDVDGNEYLDMTMGYGPHILGHAPDVVIEAANRAVANGTQYAIAHEHEVRLAELLVESIPCAERVSFCNSGTEATMHAIRVARGTTGKSLIATFEGAYHGMHDYALVGSLLSSGVGDPRRPGAETDCAGIPESIANTVVKLAYNADESLERIRELKDELAVVLIEPIPTALQTDISPFLRKLREVTRECGVLLLFDEVISGFRCQLGGAQAKYGIVPDLATYGKVMGGGFPVGAVTGTESAMESILSDGNIEHDLEARKVAAIGTFNANPVTMQAGAAVIGYLRDNPETYDYINIIAERTRNELNSFAATEKIPFKLIGVDSWFMPFFGDKPFSHARDMHDPVQGARNVIFCSYLRARGVSMPDMHIAFFSAAHSEADVDRFIEISQQVLLDMREQGLF